MAECSAKTEKSFNSDTVDYLAVTETKEKSFTFRWNINKFRKLFQQESKFIHSPMFIYEEGGTRYNWYISLLNKHIVKERNSDEQCEFVSIYVRTAVLKEPLEITLQFGILDHEENLLKTKLSCFTINSAHKKFGWSRFEKIETLLDPKNHILDNDVLRIYCKIWISNSVTTQKVITGVEADAVKKKLERDSEMLFDFQNLFVSSMFTDTLVQGPNKTLKAHKAILCSRSSVFRAMYFEGIVGNIIKITDFDDYIICGMLQYIYSGKICPIGVLEWKATELLQIAEKYDIKGLKAEAEVALIRILSLENVADLLCLADMCNAFDLKAKAIEFVNIVKEDVIQTEGFKKMLITNKTLFMDLYLGMGH